MLKLSASGKGTEAEIEGARLEVEILSLAALTSRLGQSDVGLGGQVTLSGDLAGPYDWPLGALEIRASNLEADSVTLGDFAVKARSTSPGRKKGSRKVFCYYFYAAGFPLLSVFRH